MQCCNGELNVNYTRLVLETTLNLNPIHGVTVQNRLDFTNATADFKFMKFMTFWKDVKEIKYMKLSV